MDYLINEDYIAFYTSFFNDQDKAIDLLNRCYDLTESNIFPRRMVNQLARSILFSDYCYLHKSGNRSFQVFIWMSLIESYEYILHPDIDSEKVDKLAVILNFFRSHLNDEDRILLTKNLRRSVIDDKFYENRSELPIDTISRILYSIRNEFTHGLEFHTSLFSDSNEEKYLESIKMKEFKKDTKAKRDFEFSITHEQLRDIIIRTSLNKIENLLT
ncbi:hypothetical protein [Paenibacillus graminis]|uniref:hypothetical protein n=3 Tax=Paenibacillus graminis TaxID=189425 RepID=UPI002DBAF1F7|nr:hypothetical protein [Paenibacillus graminis]MEC0169893.1 hypothetical protein [Paenibacillus graminis]